MPFCSRYSVQLSKSSPVVVPSPGPELGNILSPVIREIRFLVYVLSEEKTECHQSVSHAIGEIRDYQGLHESFWGRSVSVGLCYLKHCPADR